MSRNTHRKPGALSPGGLLPAAAIGLLWLGCIAALWAQTGAREDGRETRDGSRPVEPARTSASDTLLQDARTLAAEGKLAEAAEAYDGWLGENAGHTSFGAVLVEAVESQLFVERALELLRIYTPRVRDTARREVCLASQIELLQMLGRTEQALGLLRSYPSSPQWLYRQAQLLYQQGLTDEAEQSLEQARSLLGGSAEETGSAASGERQDQRELEARIWLLQARIYLLEGRAREAESLFGVLNVEYAGTSAAPGILLAWYEYLAAAGKEAEAAQQLEALAQRFPGSPETALALEAAGEGRIGYFPAPYRVLPRSLPRLERPPQPAAPAPQTSAWLAVEESEGSRGGDLAEESARRREPHAGGERRERESEAPQGPGEEGKQGSEAQPQNVMVQTGSFRDPENAHYMVRDLRASGFEADVVQKRIAGTLYYRVVVGSPMPVETAQEVLMKLKDANFEGVFLFPD